MAKGISEIVGDAPGTGKSRVTVYRALKQLLCAACGETIGEGALFTRRSVSAQGLRILARCRKCAPFNLELVGGNGRRPSALLESLLTPQHEPIDTQRVRKPDAGRKAVERRLGPALRRCRQRLRS